MMSMEMNYSSNAKGNLGVTLGAIGTGLAGVNALTGNGFLGNLFGGAHNCGCNEDHVVNRYEASQSARIAELETEVKLRDANTYTLQQINGLRDYVEGRFDKVEHELCDQRVYNAANNAAISCVQGQIAQLYSLTKLIIPAASVCPAPMPQYNSWTAPTTPTTGA